MTQAMIITAFVLYIVMMLLVGYYFSHKNNSSSSEFYLGGRQLGPFVAAMSAEASDMSSWLLMGIPGLAFITGFASPFWTVLGLGIGTYLNWLFTTKRLHRYTIRLGAVTIPEFLSKRYHDKHNVLMAISAIVILIFFIPYTSAGFKAVGVLLDNLFGMGYHNAMLVGIVVILAYTIMGGFMAVATNDLIQSIVMTIALIIVVCFVLSLAGGIDGVMQNAQALPGYLSALDVHDVATGNAKPYGFLNIISTMAWGLGYFGMPHILVRFMAFKREEDMKLSRRIATVWVFISMFVAIAIGIIGYTVAKNGFLPMYATTSEAESTIIDLSNVLATYGLVAAFIAGIVLAGILASTVSTADSQLLAAASAFSENVVRDVLGWKVDAKTSMYVARGTIVFISFIALFLAWNPDSSIFTIVSFAWAGFGAAFGPVMLASLFWRRTTLSGAISGMVVGGIMIFVWKYLIAPIGGVWGIYELLPAFICSALTIVIVSLCTEKPSEQILSEFDSIKDCNRK